MIKIDEETKGLWIGRWVTSQSSVIRRSHSSSKNASPHGEVDDSDGNIEPKNEREPRDA